MLVALGTAAVVWSLAVGCAHAYEDQVGGSVLLGYSSAPGSDHPAHGALLGGVFSVGLDDVFTLRGRADYAFHPGPPENHHLFAVGVEILYLIDILEWVPYFGVGATGLAWRAAGQLDLDAGGQVIGGLEYLYERELIFGVDVRGLFPMAAPGGAPAQLLIGLTVTRLWEL